jgi:hypothetical protein
MSALDGACGAPMLDRRPTRGHTSTPHTAAVASRGGECGVDLVADPNISVGGRLPTRADPIGPETAVPEMAAMSAKVSATEMRAATKVTTRTAMAAWVTASAMPPMTSERRRGEGKGEGGCKRENCSQVNLLLLWNSFHPSN